MTENPGRCAPFGVHQKVSKIKLCFSRRASADPLRQESSGSTDWPVQTIKRKANMGIQYRPPLSIRTPIVDTIISGLKKTGPFRFLLLKSVVLDWFMVSSCPFRWSFTCQNLALNLKRALRQPGPSINQTSVSPVSLGKRKNKRNIKNCDGTSPFGVRASDLSRLSRGDVRP